MFHNLVLFLINAAAFYICGLLLKGVSIGGKFTAIIAAVVYSVVTLFCEPILKILALPINLISIWLTNLLVNAALLYITAVVMPGFRIANFFWAIIFSLALSIANGVLRHLLGVS